MNIERIKQLEQYIQDDPSDPFSRYALALELANDEQEKAIELLLTLIKEVPSYVPSYYQAATLLIECNRLEETKIVIEQGLLMARQQRDQKAASELKQLQDELD